MAVKIKRVYDLTDKSDGIRILVDRLWPRGISKEKAQIDEWLKELAPSDQLRKWFRHEPGRWQEFQKRYHKELESLDKQELLKRLRSQARKRNVTLLFAAKDEEYNNAKALLEFLSQK